MRNLRPQASRYAHGSGRVQLRPQFATGGFTLVELLVVLALLLILTTLYWGYNSPQNQRRQKIACQANLEKIFVALDIYARESAGKFPVAPDARRSEEALDVLVPKYTADTSIFICPGSKDSDLPAGESFRKRKISYAYYMGRGSGNTQEALMSDRQVNALAKQAGQYAFSPNGKPPGNNHYQFGGNFLFCDGHCEPSPAQVPFPLPLTPGVVLLNPRP